MNGQNIHLVVGADGTVGRALVGCLRGLGEHVVETTRRRQTVSPSRLWLDLAEIPEAWRIPEQVAVAYLCAGVTKLEECRTDPAGTSRINLHGIATLANRLADSGAFVVFPSTNQVFDGSLPHRSPSDRISPVTEYGRQKAQAEQRLLALGPRACVVRFSKLLAPHAALLHGWVRALRAQKVIHPFSDAVMSPVPLAFAVEVLLSVGLRRMSGMLQVSAAEDVTYEEAARHLAQRLGAPAELLEPVCSDQSALWIEPAPRHTTLDITRLRTDLGMEPPGVWAAIDSVLGL